ncbi:hypothetical protein EV182_003195 [Spiromyces aspiralis]|uniref:Uncharacterized protein n=1 Tax=Spiromyces aspiralis TaxID=68401 RepID=A0ACC1HD12_9FUNG|nr:hypothetical protein EV182_003195 [Spiromyces aspiralis]
MRTCKVTDSRGVEFDEDEIEVVLKAANGAVNKEGRVIYKNSWRVTSEHDTQCETQINREEGSWISPETRRRRMRMEQPAAAAGDGPRTDGISERVQRTIRGCEAEYKRWNVQIDGD